MPDNTPDERPELPPDQGDVDALRGELAMLRAELMLLQNELADVRGEEDTEFERPQNLDKYVAATETTAPGVLGDAKDNGVLRTTKLKYTQSANHVTIDPDYGSGGDGSPAGGGLPEGTADGDMMVWDHTDQDWELNAGPATDAVRVWDASASGPAKVKWLTETTAYAVLQINSSGEVVFGYVRAHG